MSQEDFTQSFDAMEWARAFVAVAREHPTMATDEGTMVGWFANALMRGYDEAMRRQGYDLRPGGSGETRG